MVELTKAEEQILHHLWELGEGTVQDILARIDEEKRPSRTTVSTVIRILEQKEAVGHKPGAKREYIYYPLLKKEDYSQNYLKNLVKRYFDGSFPALACFFVKENNLSMEELEELLEEIKKGSELERK